MNRNILIKKIKIEQAELHNYYGDAYADSYISNIFAMWDKMALYEDDPTPFQGNDVNSKTIRNSCKYINDILNSCNKYALLGLLNYLREVVRNLYLIEITFKDLNFIALSNSNGRIN